jgi:hypothetical protein
MIVGMLVGGATGLGNLTLKVSRASGFYRDIVMAGAATGQRLDRRGRGAHFRPKSRVLAAGRG